MQVTPWKFCSSRVHDQFFIKPVFTLVRVTIEKLVQSSSTFAVLPHLKCWMWTLLKPLNTFSRKNIYSTPAASDAKIQKTLLYLKKKKKNNQIDDRVITFIQPHTLLNSSRTTFCRNDEMVEFQNLFIMHHRGDISLNNGRPERRKYLIHFIFYLLFLSVDSLKGSSRKGHKS